MTTVFHVVRVEDATALCSDVTEYAIALIALMKKGVTRLFADHIGMDSCVEIAVVYPLLCVVMVFRIAEITATKKPA